MSWSIRRDSSLANNAAITESKSILLLDTHRWNYVGSLKSYVKQTIENIDMQK